MHDPVDVGAQLVDPRVEVHRGREVHLALARLEVEAELHDRVRRGLVEVLEAGDPERVLAVGHAGAHVATDVAVAALAVEDPPSRGDREADVVGVHRPPILQYASGSCWTASGTG